MAARSNKGAEGPKRRQNTGRQMYYDPGAGELWGTYDKDSPIVKRYRLKPIKKAAAAKIAKARGEARGTYKSQSKTSRQVKGKTMRGSGSSAGEKKKK